MASLYNLLDKMVDTINGHTDAIGSVDWKNVQNKPFEMVGSDTLTWDGNTEGKEPVMNTLYHVTDVYPTLLDVQNGVSATFNVSNGASLELSVKDMSNEFGEFYMLMFNGAIPVAFALSQNVGEDSKGVYLMCEEGQNAPYVNSLTINGYTGFNPQEKIKQEALPNGIGGMLVTITENAETGDYTADKTFDEILNAVKKGAYVSILYDGMVFVVSSISDVDDDGYGRIDFVCIGDTGYIIHVFADGNVTYDGGR
jgi:hypothetical protein